MTKPRLLVPISLQFSVRYLLRSGLLSQIAQFAQPVIALAWEDAALSEELEHRGFEVHRLPGARWGGDYETARGLVNLWHERRLDSPSTKIRERRQNLDRSLSLKLRRRIRKTAHSVQLAVPEGPERSRRREESLFWSDTNARVIERELQSLKIDAIFSVTPFLVDEEMTVRILTSSGVPAVAAILSFDNLTTRSWIPVTFDSYLLWNHHNVNQLRRAYPEARERQIEIVGTPQFDFYWKPEYLLDENEWRARLSLPVDRPVLLFGGGYFTCAPHEPQFLGHLDDAIEGNEIPGKPIVLFRRHPVDPIERWQGVLRRARHVVLDNPWPLGQKILGHTNIGADDIRKLVSTLYHSQVHVNVASTMTIDGAILDKPQVGPAYDESPSRKYHRAALECYHQEHFLPIAHSGGIDIARSRRELIEAVCRGFTEPERLRDGRRRLVREICTFDDGQCASRVVSAVRKFVQSEVTAPTSLSATA